MRLRNVTGSREIIARNPYVISDAQRQKEMRGHWRELFQRKSPLHIEIGMGKGRFLLTMAGNNPQINYVGIEKYSSVLVRAADKRLEYKGDNLYLVRMEAEGITDVFSDGEVDRIYLNFSDPWPKDRHAKRRLTSPLFWERYDKILSPDGHVMFKTDNRPLFDYSLQMAEEAGWTVEKMSYDLHHGTPVTEDVMTEYEERFVREGTPICYMDCVRKKAD